VCTLIARGTAGATLAVVQTASPRRGELVQGLTADAALSAGEVQNVKAPTGLVLEKYFVPAGGRVEADTPLAQFDPDGVKDALARAKTELARLRLQREKLLAGDTADTSSLSSASTQRDRAQADYNAQKAQNDAAVAAARNDADTAQSALDAANAALAELQAQTDPPASEEALAAAQAAADAAAAALAEKQAALAAARAPPTAGKTRRGLWPTRRPRWTQRQRRMKNQSRKRDSRTVKTTLTPRRPRWTLKNSRLLWTRWRRWRKTTAF
ncbi:MAG: hypothetical protein ACLUBZ_15105, partial [Ruthenibacterium lactatiformans]|uniref:hypothetical protein n=1 Tax=Ruthenibacterium lactatiformans TaxID=1550024 RepID=UPI003994E1A8